MARGSTQTSSAPSLGDTVSIHASSAASPCTLTVKRLGADTVEVARIDDLVVADLAIPPDVDAEGCHWPAVAQFEIGSDWSTG